MHPWFSCNGRTRNAFSMSMSMSIGRKSWFSIPLHLAYPLEGSPSEYCHPVWCGKTRMMELPDGENILRIRITVYTQYRRVTDGQTNISRRHSPRFAYASRGNNWNDNSLFWNMQSENYRCSLYTWQSYRVYLLVKFTVCCSIYSVLPFLRKYRFSKL